MSKKIDARLVIGLSIMSAALGAALSKIGGKTKESKGDKPESQTMEKQNIIMEEDSEEVFGIIEEKNIPEEKNISEEKIVFHKPNTQYDSTQDFFIISNTGDNSGKTI